jgi:hypothetical protein
MSDRRPINRADPHDEDAAFERRVREVLGDRGRTTNGDVRAVLDDLGHLPARGGGRRSWIAAAAAIVVLIGAGALVAGRLSLPGIGGPGPTDPTRFADDPRLAACESDLGGPAVQAFEMTHAMWFPLHFPGWTLGAPELEVDDPALVVIGAEQPGHVTLGNPRASGDPEPNASPTPTFHMCIAVGPPGAAVIHDYGVTWFDRIVPVLSDADIARAAHLDPEVLADPANWTDQEELLAACGGTFADIQYVFAIDPLSDLPRHVPAVGPISSLNLSEWGTIVVFRNPSPLLIGRLANAPTGPTIHDLCVIPQDLAPGGQPLILPDVDITGLRVWLDDPAAIGPPPTSEPSTTSEPSPVRTVVPITPEPGPAWAGDARAALTCAGDPSLFEPRNAPGSDVGAGPTPDDALRFYLQSFEFSVDPLPIAGYVEAGAIDDARLYTTDVGGNVKAAIVISKSASGTNGPWVVSSVAACPESELDPTTVTGAHRIGRWTDASGSEVPTSVLAATADCYGGTQVRLDGRLFVRIPQGGVDDTALESSWAPDVPIPADVVKTSYRSGDLRLYVASSGRGIYIGSGGRGERLPHVIGDEVVRTDCN